MDILNLTEGFEPLGAGTVSFTTSIFADGAINFRIVSSVGSEVLITARVNNSDDFMCLIMATDALREMGTTDIYVFLPFLPYARQDRVCRQGEALSLRAFAQLINVQAYKGVYAFEAHSAVASQQIGRFRSISNSKFVIKVLDGRSDVWTLFPDKGAGARYGNVCSLYADHLCVCEKVRGDSGAIMETKIPVEDFLGKDVYMIDDICDGGRTFIAISQEIRKRNVGAINLIVSHGIFSHGEEVLREGGIDHVFTTDSIKVIDSPYITQVKLCDILTPVTTHA